MTFATCCCLLVFSVVLLCAVTLSRAAGEFADAPTPVTSTSSSSVDEWSGVAYVGTMDGALHAVDVSTGERLWSVATGDALFGASVGSASSRAPLLIPGVNGAIFVHVPHSHRPLQRLPVRVADLVARAPFQAADGTMYMGRKRSRIFVVDRHSGAVLRTIVDSDAFDVAAADDELAPLPDDVLLVGRSDYLVSARDTVSGATLWNMSSGEYTVQLHNAHGLSQSLNAASVDPSTELDERHLKYPLVVSSDGSLQLFDVARGLRLWSLQFDAAVVSAHGMVSTGRIHQLPHVAVPPTPAPSSGSAPTPGRPLTIDDNDSPLIHHGLQSGGRVVPGGVVVVGEFANSLFAYECPSVSQDSIVCDSDDPACILGTHVLVDSTLPMLLGDRPTPRPVPLLPPPPQSDEEPPSVASLIVGVAVALVAAGAASYWQLVGRFRRAPEATPPVPPVEQPAPLKPPGDLVRIGAIDVNKQRVLGYGSGGTVVYEGALGGRKVAVKRMLIDFFEVAQQEISLLLAADEHPHIVRYFAQEQDEQFVYLALGYCEQTLADRICDAEQQQQSADGAKKVPLTGREALAIARGIVDGVAALHAFNIVHRDLKPQNVLLSLDGVVKISDMGLARRVNPDSDSFSTERGAGSVGWQAPEQMAFTAQKQAHQEPQTGAPLLPTPPVRLTRHVDLFALGCLLFYTITNGEHPFGPALSRPLRIARGESDLQALTRPNRSVDALALERRVAARQLVALLVSADPQQRPVAASVKRHPLFWSGAEQLAFLSEASDRFEAEVEHHWKVNYSNEAEASSSSSNNNNSSNSNWRKPAPPSPVAPKATASPKVPKHAMLRDIELQAALVLGRPGWRERVPSELLKDAKQFRGYKNSVRDLLRFVRNKAHHFRELPAELQARMGVVPDGYVAFFLDIFPELLMHTYGVVRKHLLHEASFQQFVE